MYRTSDITIATHSDPEVTVRPVGQADAHALARLAALDSAEMPAGPTLAAVRGGEIVAALPVHGGRAIADPFQRTAALVELLELRAAQLRGQARPQAAATSYAGRLRGLVRGPRVLSPR